jgi:uncharacterized protein YcbK (DUF882 family)
VIDGMGDRSSHFSDSEFRDHETAHSYPPPDALVDVLERIRELRPGPLVVVSGHRCCAHNAMIGGAPASRHIAGDAADIAPGRATPDEARQAGAVGVGERAGWAVHVDVRPGPAASWTYD